MNIRIKLILLFFAFLILGLGYISSTSFAAISSKVDPTFFPTPPMSFTKSSDVRSSMRSLVEEHTVTTDMYLIRLYDGKSATAFKNNLNNNTNTLGDVIGDVYGTDVRSRFVEMWNNHIMEYESYTKAVKANDSTAMNRARNNLHTQANAMEEEFNTFNSTSVGLLGEMMIQHVDAAMALVDAHAEKNDNQEAILVKRGFDQAGQLGDYLSQIIITEKPDFVK